MNPSSPSVKGYQFGAFKGVFTPSILTIFGVIMYLRFGWVLGNLGLPLTLLAVTLSCAVTFLTGLSLTAIASNMRIGGGGAYYIISRALGPEAGGAIGVPLFLAQALGVAFYISGFSEAVTAVLDVSAVTEALPFPITPPRLVAVVTLLLLTLLAATSADWALRAQYLIMAIIGASLISFFLGAFTSDPLVTDPSIDVPAKASFWVVFAVFFPAVTGIEAGIAMSGDLKDPAKALPRGTLGAVLVGYGVYMVIPFVLGYAVHDETALLTDPLIMRRVARWGGLILGGVWAASLSSALGALLGGPRTLQALARDRVIPRFLGRGYGAQNDPRLATFVTFGIAMVTVLLGDLNAIAPVLSMFFLTSYGLINLSAGLECVVGSPSWRPSFRIRPGIAFLGAGGCFAIMFMISSGATFMAWSFAALVFLLMQRRHLRTQWNDMRYGLLMLTARFAISRLMRRKPDVRGWRPNILAFSGSPETRGYLVDMAQALARGPACLTLATVVPTRAWSTERVLQLQDSMGEYLEKRGIRALVKVFPSDDMLDGVLSLIQGYGFGPIVPNTIMIGVSDVDRHLDKMAQVIRFAFRMERNVIQVFDTDPRPTATPATRPRIDVWWRGGKENIGLMLTLAYLLHSNEEWGHPDIMIKRVVGGEGQDVAEIERNLESYVQSLRIPVGIQLIPSIGRPAFDLIRESSADAALIFMGLRAPAEEEAAAGYAGYYRHLVESTRDLPLAIVLAAEPIEFKALMGLE